MKKPALTIKKATIPLKYMKRLLTLLSTFVSIIAFAQQNKPSDAYAAAMGLTKSNPTQTLSVDIDWDKSVGKVKELHGVNNSPVVHYRTIPEFKEAGIPYSRTHDTYSRFGGNVYVDIPNIFPNFDADPNDPASYDFTFTDAYINSLVKSGTKVFYRLGVTIENNHKLKAYRIYPPKDNLKWAKICAGIIRHYTKGWAKGHNYDIKYWEIWNEPENPMMWKGTRQEFFELYKTAATYLKKEFPEIKIGGFAGCGFFEITRPMEKCPTRGLKILDWFHEFIQLAADKKNPIPLDFFSWHLYTDDPKELGIHAEYVRKSLDKLGLTHVENINNEWNYTLGAKHAKTRKNEKGASMCAATMCIMQQGSVDKAMYYDATPTRSYCGIYNYPEMTLTKTYFVFKAFNELYKLGTSVAISDRKDKEIYAIAATDESKSNKAILVTNYSDEEQNVKLNFKGDATSVVLIDTDYTFTEINYMLSSKKTLKMPPYSTFLIKVK